MVAADTDVPGGTPLEPVEIHTDDEQQYSDAQLEEHAEAGLADCMEALGVIEDATAVARGAAEGPATLAVNPLVHAVASLAGSAILIGRILQGTQRMQAEQFAALTVERRAITTQMQRFASVMELADQRAQAFQALLERHDARLAEMAKRMAEIESQADPGVN